MRDLGKIKELLESRIGYTVGELNDNSLGVPFEYNDKRFILLALPDSSHLFPLILTIENMEVTPHISEQEYNWDGEKARVLCLLNSENYIATHIPFESKIDFVLDQFERLMNLSPRQITIEMQKEFMYYWDSNSKNEEEYQIYVPSSYEPQELDIIYIRDKEKSKKTKKIVIKDKDVKINKFYLDKGIQGKALHIPISNPIGIMPPHKGNPWNGTAIQKIIHNPIYDNITPKSYKYLKKYRHKGKQLHIVFSMKIPSGFEIMFVAKLEFSSSRNDYLVNKITSSLISVNSIKADRFDIGYMKSRIGLDALTEERKVLIAGAGSLGSYIAREIPKIGITEFTLVDPDTFNTGNVLRGVWPRLM